MRDWVSAQLGDVVDFLTGFPFKSAEYVEDPSAPRLLRGDNIGQGVLRWDGAKRWPMHATQDIAQYWVHEGDVVLAMDRPWIDAGLKFASVRNTDLPALVVQRVARLRGTSRLDTRYLKYIVGSQAFTAHVLSIQTGTAVPHISANQIKSFKCHLPPLEMQRAIAHILGTLDDKIELNRRTIETLKAMAQALFKDWFIDFGPVRAKMEGRARYLTGEVWASFPSELRDSKVGLIPSSWEIQTLKELTSKIGSGATPRGGKEVYVDEGVSLIRSQNVYDSAFVWSGLARITDSAAEQLSGVEVRPEDVLLNLTGASILRTCVVDPGVLPARVNQHVAIIRARTGIPPRYLHLHLLQKKTKDYLLGLNAGASREAVTKAHIESVPILMPDPSILEHFAKAVAVIYAKVDALLDESRSLVDLRDLLLPKLISGELRIQDAERFLAGVAS